MESDNLVLKVLLDGLYDIESPLSKLRGMHHILKYIWTDVRNYWQSHITLPDLDANWDGYWQDHRDTAIDSWTFRHLRCPDGSCGLL